MLLPTLSSASSLASRLSNKYTSMYLEFYRYTKFQPNFLTGVSFRLIPYFKANEFYGECIPGVGVIWFEAIIYWIILLYLPILDTSLSGVAIMCLAYYVLHLLSIGRNSELRLYPALRSKFDGSLYLLKGKKREAANVAFSILDSLTDKRGAREGICKSHRDFE